MLRNEGYTVVTGGAGFIGSCIIRELNRRGIVRIVVADDLGTSDKWQNLVGKQFSEILSCAQFAEWLTKNRAHVESVIHMGACADTVERDADYLLENNYRCSQRIAEFCIENSIRFLYASSAATYGNGSEGFSDRHDRLEELHPLNMYGYSKHLFDLWLHRNNLLDSVTGVKYFNVFGPNEWHKERMASAILKMVPEAQKTGKIQLFSSYRPEYEDGEQQRDFIYVKDAAEITCDLLDSTARGIINVGSGQASSWNRLARAVFNALSLEERIEYVPMPRDLIGKYQYFTQADTAKLEQALNRKPCRFTLEQAVSDYVKAHILRERRW